MSRDELVNAYIEGSVSRRTFIRRLVAAGVSLGAAVSYAHLLSPTRAGAQTGADFYNPDFYRPPQVQMSLPSTKLADVAQDGILEVLVSTTEAAEIQLMALATAAGRPAGGAAQSAKRRKRKKPRQTTIASLVVDISAAGQRLIQVPLNVTGLRLVRSARRVNLLVTATATDRQRAVTVASTQGVLTGGKKRKKRK
jgi:hypothetical protein